MGVTVLVLDDELNSLQRINSLLKKVNCVTKIILTNDEEDALEKLILFNPEIVFIDYQLNYSTGFEFIQKIPSTNISIFIMITGHAEYALDAFKYSIFDYLLKPFKDSSFLISLERALEKNKYKFKEINIQKDKIPIKQTGKIIFINKEDITYIKSSGNYVEVYVSNNKYLVRQSISKFYENLDKSKFYRIHRFTIVNLNTIDELVFSVYGELDVKIKNKTFRVSRTYKQGLLNCMSVN